MVTGTDGKIDEEWLRGVLTANAVIAKAGGQMSDDFGRVVLHFTDCYFNDSNLWKMDYAYRTEVYSRIVQGMCETVKTYDPANRSKPSNWIYTCVKNKALNATRDVFRSNTRDSIIEMVMGLELANRLKELDSGSAAARNIRDRYTILAGLKFDDGMKEKIFRCSSSSITSEKLRTRNKLRIVLQKTRASRISNRINEMLEARHG